MKFIFLLLFFHSLTAPRVFCGEDKEIIFTEQAETIEEIDETAEVEGVFNREYLDKLLPLLKTAKKRIWFAQFLWNPDKTTDGIKEILIERKKKGVQIRGIIEETVEKNAGAVAGFKKHAIDVRLGSKKKYLHCKLWIIDDDLVLLGATNMSWASMLKNNETNVLIKNRKINSFYAGYFNKLLKNPEMDVEMSRLRTKNVHPVVDRQFYDILTERIEGAKKRIHLLLYGTRIIDRDDDVGLFFQKVAEKKKKGLDVKVILEKSDYNDILNEHNRGTEEFFREYGIEVSYDTLETTTHSKMCIIDDTVVIGSANWAGGGFFQYHEINAFIEDKILLKKALDYFSDILSHKY